MLSQYTHIESHCLHLDLTAFMQSQGYVACNALFDKPVRKLETFVGASSAPAGVRRAQPSSGVSGSRR